MKIKTMYVCSNCGREESKWIGKCSSCGEWNTFVEQTTETSKVGLKDIKKSSPATKLSSVKERAEERILSGIDEFDRVVGGGLVKDSITIITAPPGIGKTTICQQIANSVAEKGLKVLYASGEESETQIKSRANRILDKISENVWIKSSNSLDSVIKDINTIDPDFIVIDSIQTFILEEHLPSRAGSPTQTMECAAALTQIAKNPERPRAIILISQVNKQNEVAGLQALIHLVDTVLIIDGNEGEELRNITSSKNRFGSAGEIGFFSMTEKGLISIDNPSEFFMTKRKPGEEVSGSALTVVKEGNRPIITEIESLVTKTFTPYPTRIAESLGKDKLNTLVSILETRGKIDLHERNVIVKIIGGIKVREQAINLAIIISILSALLDKAIPTNVAFIADVGLTGELKRIPSIETRIRELARMGFERVFVAEGSLVKDVKGINVIQCKTLAQVLTQIF